jgi:hypothetical protein
MASYVLPQVRVFQEFSLNIEADIRPLYAFLTGGHAYLLRCSEADEKALASVGTYDHVGVNVDGVWKTCYSWPQKPTGSVLDESYTKLCIDDALLRYWTDTSDTMLKTASNKIRHPSKAFADNPSDAVTYPKHADFLDRGVKVGDIVRVTGSSDSGTTNFDLSTYVSDIEGDTVAASTGNTSAPTGHLPTASANNQATAVAADTDVRVTGTTIQITSVDATGYDGLAEGDVSETYTVECTTASTGSDHTTAVLRVTSASGNDDVGALTPSAETVATDIGTRGLTATFADDGGTEFVVGDQWTVTVTMAFTAPTATGGGTYTGLTDRVYIIEVTKGGTSYPSSPGGTTTTTAYPGQESSFPEITVTTQDGTDFSGPTQILIEDIAYPVGQYGVTIAFDQEDLRKGDRWTITATAATEGLMKTLVLGHNLDDLIPLNDDSTAVLDVALFIKKDIEVAEQHVRVPGQVNWDQSDTEFCAHANVEAFDDSWTDSGVPVALPVIKDTVVTGTNSMYTEYRAWRSDISNTIGTLEEIGDIDTAISGPLTPDNPLKYGVFKAKQNSNDQPVKFQAVANPNSTSSWVDVIDSIEDEAVYGLVPLTRDRTVLDLFQTHVGEQSGPTNNRFRAMWINAPLVTTEVVVDDTTSSDVATVLATTEDDGDTSGTQYTKLVVTSGNADLVTLGVRAGDTVRFEYAVDGWGGISYSEYVIDSVVNEETVLLETGTASEENIPIKVEIYRTLTKTEQAANIALYSGNWADRRVMSVWPNEVGSGGTTAEGYHLCAALAGLASGVLPHQGLTHVEVAGFDDVKVDYFSKTQLNTMAVNGTFVVTQDRDSGEIFTRHAVTTDDYENINVREEMITRNVDSISFKFFDQYSPYIGKSNAVPSMVEIIESETNSCIQFLRTSGFTQKLGGQLIDAEITDLRISAEFKDRILVGLSLQVPYALNNIDVHLLV